MSGRPPELQVPGGAWHPVHAAQGPLDEARAWLAASLRAAAAPTAVCVIGAGAGWVVDAVEELPGEVPLLVFEPEPACATALLGRRDLRALIEAGRLMVLSGPAFDGAATAWRLFGRMATEPPLLVHPVTAVARREATVAAARLARKAIADAQANEHARRRFAAPYLLNTLRNVPALAREADAGGLVGLYSGQPVVIAGAGPSLNRNLEELRPYRDRVVLIAADTALRPILAAGLAPDFVVAVDPGAANARHLTRLPPCEQTALVAEASVQRAIIESFAGRTFFYRVAAHHPWPWLGAAGVRVATLHAWGSVLITAFDLGVKLGGDPLVLIGADLAYTGGQPYCRGTVYEEDWTERVAGGETLDAIWRHAVSMHRAVVERHGDEQLFTAPHLVQFRDGLLNSARTVRARVVNATGAGILRGGRVEEASLESVLRRARPLRPRGLPRRTPPDDAVAGVREAVTSLAVTDAPLPEGWTTVVAEHEPPDPSLYEQLRVVRAQLGQWATEEPC